MPTPESPADCECLEPASATHAPPELSAYLRAHIRTVADWPRPGVKFRDMTPLLQSPRAMRVLVDQLVWRYMDPGRRPELVAGIDARGFIVGATLAYALNLGFVPIRKQGKLPFQTIAEAYALEYGSATVEIHADAVRPAQRVLLIDDLIATGGTMLAAARLLQRLGAEVVEAAAIVDLPELGGSAALRAHGVDVFTLLSYAGTD